MTVSGPDFAAMVAHELRGPLHKVATFSALLSERIGYDDGTTAGYLQRMEAAVDDMQRIIGALLSLVAGETPAEREPVDLTVAAREAIADLADLISDTGASVTIADLPTVEADPILMRQLFGNLISNGLTHRHHERPPRIHIDAAVERRDDASWCRMTVTDNGIGLPDSGAERAFLPFERLEASSEGVGLGLTICRAIVTGHGGSIEASDAANGGTTFTIWLPAAA